MGTDLILVAVGLTCLLVALVSFLYMISLPPGSSPVLVLIMMLVFAFVGGSVLMYAISFELAGISTNLVGILLCAIVAGGAWVIFESFKQKVR